MEHLSRERLGAGLGYIQDSPKDTGRLVLIVTRPAVDQRELPDEAVLDRVAGLTGDNWLARGSGTTPNGLADPQRQVTVMNARVAELVSAGTERMPLAGDQLYVDLDLSVGNLPAGSLLAFGQAVLEVSEVPHLGCEKFMARFGEDAMRFVNSRTGRQLRLRGMNARVLVPGTIRVGGPVTKAGVAAERVWLQQVPLGLARTLAAQDTPVPGPRSWASGYPLPGTRDAARMLVRQAEQTGGMINGYGMFQIVLRETGAVIGDIGFHGPPDEDGTVEIGYGIVPEYRGRGLVKESAVAICALAWSHPEVRKIVARTEAADQASAGVLRRTGFQETGVTHGRRDFVLPRP